LYRSVFLIVLTAWLAVAVSRSAAAQGISVDPVSWNFGPVLVGDSETFILTIGSTEPIPLRVESVTITTDPTPFLIVSDPPPPTQVLFMVDLLDVEVMFSPIELGLFDALLYIQSDAEFPENHFYVPLVGTGVATLPIPEPPTLWSFALGLVGLAMLVRRRRFEHRRS